VFHIIASVKPNNRIPKCDQVSVGIEIFPMHAAVTGGVHEQRAPRRSAEILEMQAELMSVERDELIRNGGAWVRRTARDRNRRD
jgi:hypothetical protein